MLPYLLVAGAATALYLATRPKKKPKAKAKAKRSTRSANSSWQTTEKRACASRKRKHLGGPSRADCEGGIEVKDWARPVDSGTIKREHAKGRKEIVAPGGFTEPARREARKRGMKLSYA
jgi:hypothetical protein